jgi:hypothetical protein
MSSCQTQHTSKRRGLCRRSGLRSQALVITLAMIVVASALVLAFLSLVQVDRQATAGYSQSIKAEQIGQGGLQLIVGQLQQEMSKDAPPDTGGGAYPNTAIYTNVTSANILPQLVGTNLAMPTLLKTSTNANFYTGTNGGPAALVPNGSLMASAISSTAPSVNGRSVSLARWSQAYMGTFPNATSAPNWVMMSRSGPTTNMIMGPAVADSLNNPSVANTNYVIGRFAYAIYNEGSLLDITVAGSPSSLSVSQMAQIKGTLAGADLTALGTGINAAQLIAWRNAATSVAATNYINYVTNFASTNGFEQVYPGDSTFLSRQDLISAAQNGIAGLSTNILTNLATFTREANVPSCGPTFNASDLGGNNGTGNVYAYKSNALTTGSTNRFVPYVRVPAASAGYQCYADDGTLDSDPIHAGDPVVRRRFSLARLNWLGTNGPNAAAFNPQVTPAMQTSAIQACFGLMWQPSQDSNLNGASDWQYVGPTGVAPRSTIETLDQVAAETAPREPNFFELLQAGILSGSLALNGGGGATASIIPNIHLQSNALQILRIGASIISQSSSSSTPTLIEYNQSGGPWIATGVANLPYINTVESVTGGSPDNASALAVYILVGLWNPTRQPATAPTPPPVRLRVQGSFGVENFFASTNAPNTNNPFGTGLPGYVLPIPTTAALPLSSTPGTTNGVYGFLDPRLPGTTDAATTPPASGPSNASTLTGTWVITPPLGVNSQSYVGYRMPDLQLNTTGTFTGTSSSGGSGVNSHFSFESGNPFGAILEFQSSSGKWVPYDYSNGINDTTQTWIQNTFQASGKLGLTGVSGNWTIKLPLTPLASSPANSAGPSLGIEPLFMTSDPRSLRFGEWQFDRGNTGTPASAATTAGEDSRLWTSTMPLLTGVANPHNSWQTSGYGGDTSVTDVALAPNALDPSGNGFYYPAQLARNNTANTAPNSSYVDNDGVQRMGDSGLYPSTQNFAAGNPFAGNLVRPQDRPVILNRPFQSVAELGYVPRDDPWRSLDFFSPVSADSELLDLFSVNQATSSTAGNTVAGRIDLNSQNITALEAVLNNTITDTMGSPPATMGSPLAVAQALAAYTAVTPLVNKSDLSKFVGSALPTGDFAGSDEQNIKAQREATVRALADVGQTRTWNLMIDIVAQAGRCPPTAQTLDQFVVEGERRYWLHVAIDRFTGKIIDEKLEPVAE